MNFVSTCDGAPGMSGSPVFNKILQLVGVSFDGNRQRIAALYANTPVDEGGRSIVVHGAAIWTALDRLYRAAPLVDELKSAAASVE